MEATVFLFDLQEAPHFPLDHARFPLYLIAQNGERAQFRRLMRNRGVLQERRPE